MTLTPPPGLLSAVLATEAISVTISVSGGTPAYTFNTQRVNLPAGLTFAIGATSLTLQGTVTQQAVPQSTYPYNVVFEFLVADATGHATRGIYYLPVR
jgi:hypothetical protein